MSPKPHSLTLPYLALPPGGSGPGVLLIHAWWGLNAFFKQTCDRLAAGGLSDRADAYDPQAADLAWRRTVEFLRIYLL